jgi:Holliday junction resolvase-like predicted endonuclease
VARWTSSRGARRTLAFVEVKSRASDEAAGFSLDA